MNEVSLPSIIKKQVKFKLFSYTYVWQSLLFMQLFGFVLSSTIDQSMVSKDGNVRTITGSSNSTFLMLMTYVWIVVSSGVLSSTTTKRIDFLFVATRKSQFISNIIFLCLLSAIGAITTYFGSMIISIIHKIVHDGMPAREYFTFFEHAVNVTGIFGYLLLLAAVTFLAVSLFQLNRFVLLGLLVLFGVIIYLSSTQLDDLLLQLTSFFAEESSLGTFMLKVLVSTGILFAGAWMTTRNQEVPS